MTSSAADSPLQRHSTADLGRRGVALDVRERLLGDAPHLALLQDRQAAVAVAVHVDAHPAAIADPADVGLERRRHVLLSETSVRRSYRVSRTSRITPRTSSRSCSSEPVRPARRGSGWRRCGRARRPGRRGTGRCGRAGHGRCGCAPRRRRRCAAGRTSGRCRWRAQPIRRTP